MKTSLYAVYIEQGEKNIFDKAGLPPLVVIGIVALLGLLLTWFFRKRR